jgi:hypothetical protein
MNISKKELKDIKKLIAKIDHLKDEFEIRIGDDITHHDFTKIVNKLIFEKKNGGFDMKYVIKTELDIISDNIRLTLDDIDDIKKYWITNILEENTYKILEKKKKEKIDIKNYNFRIALCEEDILLEKKSNNETNEEETNEEETNEEETNEEETNEEETNEEPSSNNQKGGVNEKKVKDFLDNLGKGKKTYRFKNRYCITSLDGFFKFDMTTVKMSTGETFKSSRVLNCVPSYEIELELVNNISDDVNEIVQNLFNNVGLILQLLTESDVLIGDKEKKKILVEYKKLIKKSNKNNNLKYNLKNNKFFFIAANPVTLQIENLLETKSNGLNILSNYAITYKADGERNFLYVSENGEVYLLNNNFTIRKTGIAIKEWSGSLIEGEYLYDKRLFLAYDMLFSKGIDIRGNNLRKSKKDVEKTGRIETLVDFIKNINKIKGDTILTIILKPYEYQNNGNRLFLNIKKLWDNRNNLEWQTDGLIFVPIYERYPDRNMSWKSLFKWKPREYNSIDFLIKDIGVFKTKIIKKIPIQYKEFKLKVTGGVNIYNNKKNGKNWEKLSKPVDFTIDDNKDCVVGIPIGSDGKMYAYEPFTQRKYEIMDDTIVEFVYDPDNEIFKWKPIRIRNNKTNKYKSGEKYYGNYEVVAKSIWQSMSNEVTIEILTSGYIPEKVIQKLQVEVKGGGPKNTIMKKDSVKETDTYYTENDITNNNTTHKLGDYMKKDRYEYQNFHNIVIKRELLKNTCKKGDSLLDLASGRGGDIKKWSELKLEKVLGIELYQAGVNTAISRLKSMKGLSKNLEINFIQGDVGIKLDSFVSDKLIASKYSFDVISCMFAMHYLYTEEKFNTFLQNIHDNLKVGGHYTGCCFDGERVFNALKGKKLVQGVVNDNLIWKIIKNYEKDHYDNEDPNFGLNVSVYIKSIGQEQDENLLNFKYFEKKMEEYGMKKVKVEGFSNIYERLKNNKKYRFIQNMTEKEREFSFYNNSFIFQKVKNVENKNKAKVEEDVKVIDLSDVVEIDT